jgi:hypothetical protein
MLQMVQAITEDDKEVRHTFCYAFVNGMVEYVISHVCLVMKAFSTSQAMCIVYNMRIRVTENPHTTREYSRDSQKVIVFCALSNKKTFTPVFFVEKTNRVVHLDTLEN